MRSQLFLRLLLSLALAFAGSAAQLHALAHAQHDLSAAGPGKAVLASPDKAPAPLTHATDRCLVFHALDGVAAQPGAHLTLERAASRSVSPAAARCGTGAVAAFQPRAPPPALFLS